MNIIPDEKCKKCKMPFYNCMCPVDDIDFAPLYLSRTDADIDDVVEYFIPLTKGHDDRTAVDHNSLSVEERRRQGFFPAPPGFAELPGFNPWDQDEDGSESSDE